MKFFQTISIATVSLFPAAVAVADTSPAARIVSVDEVIAMQAELPPEAHPHAKPAGYDKAGDAVAVARSISKYAKTYKAASLAATYAAYESSNQIRAKGDRRNGEYRSFGAFQLNEITPQECSLNLDCAVQVWFALTEDAETRCAQNPPDEKLAVVASGDCSLGRQKVRIRAEIAKRVLNKLEINSMLPKE